MTLKEYIEDYEAWTNLATGLWANTERPAYEAEVWYSNHRNGIVLDMLNQVSPFRSVLAVGAGHRPDEELINAIDAKSKLRTDLIQSEGIEMLVDACEMPFKDSSFDLVVCREVIEHVLDGRALMSGCNRVLEMGGYLLLTTPNGYHLPPSLIPGHRMGFSPQAFLATHGLFGLEVVDRRGDVPNVFYGLIPLAEQGNDVLSDFKDIAERIKNFPDSYYVSTALFVLSRKVKCL